MYYLLTYLRLGIHVKVDFAGGLREARPAPAQDLWDEMGKERWVRKGEKT